MNFIFSQLKTIIGSHFSFSLALVTSAGIIAQRASYIIFFILLICATISFYAHLITIKKFYRIYLLKSCFFVSFFCLGLFASFFQQKSYSNLVTILSNQTYDLIGTVDSISHSQAGPYSWTIHISVKSMRLIEKNHANINWKNFSWKLIIHTCYKPTVQIADIIQINRITFNYKPKNKNKMIYNCISPTIFLPSTSFFILHRPFFSFTHYIHCKRNQLFDQFKKSMTPLLFYFFSSIFLGTKENINSFKDIKQRFQQWGIAHFMARSGLHVVIVAYAFHILMRITFIPFFLRHIIIILSLIFYGLLSWVNITFIRAITTYSLMSLGDFFEVETDSFHLLNLTYLTFIISNPVCINHISLQLSFTITYILLLIIRLQNPKSITMQNH